VACILKFTFLFADIILPVLNSSLDNPIATSSCEHSSSVHTGTGDFEFRDVLEDVSCMTSGDKFLSVNFVLCCVDFKHCYRMDLSALMCEYIPIDQY